MDHETHALAYYAAHLSTPPQPILFHQPSHHTKERFGYTKPAINRAAAALTPRHPPPPRAALYGLLGPPR